MGIQLGQIIKRTRKEKHLSQKIVAEGICAQSMLSAIENGKYSPNANLLIAICEKLQISLNEISLLNNFQIANKKEFNQKVSELCNTHQYFKLKKFLLDPKTIEQLDTDYETQAYYYYLAIALLQDENNLTEATENLQIAISFSNNSKNISTITRLCYISLSYIKAKLKQKKSAKELLSKATKEINTAPYEENLNIIFYLAALVQYELKQIPNTILWLEKGIEYTTKNNSHYMLANFYRLLAEVAKDSESAIQHSNFLADLFHESVYQDL